MGVVAADLLRAAQLHARAGLGRARAHRVLHRLRRDRRARAAGRHGREPDRGGARLRRVAVAGVPLRDAAADHAGRHRRRADGLHAVDRRLRDHVLHRRRGHGDAAAADLLDDQDRGHARGQRRVNAADAADVAADRRRDSSCPRACCVRTRRPDHEDAPSPSSSACAALPRPRQGQAAPLQLEQLHRAGDGQALRGAVQVRGRADLLLRQRGAAGQARRRRQGLRRPGADRPTPCRR